LNQDFYFEELASTIKIEIREVKLETIPITSPVDSFALGFLADT
jgi:hypothetical protein